MRLDPDKADPVSLPAPIGISDLASQDVDALVVVSMAAFDESAEEARRMIETYFSSHRRTCHTIGHKTDIIDMIAVHSGLTAAKRGLSRKNEVGQ